MINFVKKYELTSLLKEVLKLKKELILYTNKRPLTIYL